MTYLLSWFTRNTKYWHIVYNWLPYSKTIERDALCPDVHVADFQTLKKLKQSCLTFRDEVIAELPTEHITLKNKTGVKN